MTTFIAKLTLQRRYHWVIIATLFFCTIGSVEAATLAVTPATGVYKTGQSFTVNVLVNTAGVPVNAADGTMSFNPRELSVVAVSRTSSIFNLWTAEPTFSNAAGTITFSGGVPTGYTGVSGVVMSVTFKSLVSGAARVTLSGASVLAADGRGTNVLTNMSGGTYTLSAVDSQPTPEVIVEYVAPANTPIAPKVQSATHGDQARWYTANTATLSWTLPTDVVAVRTLLDTAAISVPTKVYDNPPKEITLKDLQNGVSFFHIQFKNAQGWGKVAHYRLAIDNEKPTSLNLTAAEIKDLASPLQQINIAAADATSPVLRYVIKIDTETPYEHTATSSKFTLSLPSLRPGDHTIVVEAFDSAGNSIVNSYSFTISAFDKPVITQYPSDLTIGTYPVIKGTTRSLSVVTITFTDAQGQTILASSTSDAAGEFTVLPTVSLGEGVYKVSAVATDELGAQSEVSDTVTILIKKPDYIVLGTWLISLFSVLIPLVALAIISWVGVIYSFHRLRRLKNRLRKESGEATAMAEHEFLAILSVLDQHEEKLLRSKKTGKLSVAEAQLFADLRATVSLAENRVEKEVADVSALVKNNSK